jgi:hypothetical protein
MATRTHSTVITATVDIIDRKDVPKEFYLPKFSYKKDWKRLFKFNFSNGFTYYYGTNKTFVDGIDLMTNLTIESDLVDDSKSHMELKIQFFKNFKRNIKLQNCKKIYDWYKSSRNQIKDIVNQFMSN